MNRYALISEKMPREFVLLQGTGCQWKQCTFCDYHLDTSDAPFLINSEVLSQVTGEYGVLDVINSGSCVELDKDTIDLIRKVVNDRKIKVLWFEAHWMYKDHLQAFAANFPNTLVKFRAGMETFDADMRTRWNKGISPSVTYQEVAKYFKGICLLIGVQGQTREAISKDIEIALSNFEYFSINAFVKNSTDTQRDDALIEWFVSEWTERLKDNPKVEILISNTDLGVG